MACGVPVLATTVSGVTDHVVEGVTGYLVEPRSAASMASRIVEVLADSASRRATGEVAMRRIVDNLSWQAIVRETIDRVYRPLSALEVEAVAT